MRRIGWSDWLVAAGLAVMAAIMLAQLTGCAAAGRDQGVILAKLRADVEAELRTQIEARLRAELEATLTAQLHAEFNARLEVNASKKQQAGTSINSPWLVGGLAALPYGAILLHELLKRFRPYRVAIDRWKGKPPNCRW